MENAFYREGLETFSDDELMNADAPSKFGEEVRREVPEYLRTVGAHEAAHVKAISQTVETLDGSPVRPCPRPLGHRRNDHLPTRIMTEYTHTRAGAPRRTR
ncbi:ferritin-like domain-containing protein [Haloarculaceae archaeon H-GB11]|nr:ferritin-like domain-containing protein [Haloarculaceae archaeon H-GB11]